MAGDVFIEGDAYHVDVLGLGLLVVHAFSVLVDLSIPNLFTTYEYWYTTVVLIYYCIYFLFYFLWIFLIT